jgi:hypothetical protein
LLALFALCALALGTMLVGAGTAGASSRTGHYAKIKFYNKQRVVTMLVPAQCPNVRQAPCVWMLYVNEPENPAQTVVGTQTAPPGGGKVLQVNYPKNFCGVIQADVVVGPSPWLFESGRVREINTFPSPGKGHGNATAFCPTTPTTTPGSTTPPHPPGGNGGGNGQGGNAQASALPFAAATTGSGASGTGDAAGSTAAAASPATLPFTGLDVKPLIFVGAALILVGLFILTGLEQRRRALRRIGNVVNTGAEYSSRASHWFLGD